MQTFKIAIADDQKLFRKGMAALLKDYGLQVIFEAEDGEDLLKQLMTQRPDIILLDLKMPKMDGLEALQHIKRTYPNIKVLILTMHSHEKFILHTMEMGCNGFLMKDAEPEEVLEAIEQTATKGDYYNDKIIQVMRKGLTQKKRGKPTFGAGESLSDRELEVLQLTCEGMTASEIGEQLFITKRTVEGHRGNILEKIGGKNLTSMIVYAIQHNLVNLD
jgi:DNA-binding NarL/FixJ family response regulator